MPAQARQAAVIGQEVIDPANWTGEDLKSDQRWIIRLSDDELNAMVALAKKIRGQIGDDPNQLMSLPAEAFDFGPFLEKIKAIKAELKDGLGAVLIRGLSLDKGDPIEAAAIYWGLGRHLGMACSNNAEGDVFGHVTDTGKTQRDAKSRGYQTREEMAFHCDQSSIVGLLCVRTPQSGGVSKIASSIALHNTMLARSPASVKVMSEPFFWTKHGEMNEGEDGYYQSPVFNFLDGKLCTSLGPTHIRKGHDFPDVPDLTPAQVDALQLAKEIAEEQHYGMLLERGDMQFLNNSVVLHTRTEYQDWPEPERKRLLWRLWLVDPAIRPLTPYIKQWGAGVKVTATKERIVL